MASKNKGTRYERELFHMFWDTNEFSAVRIAGSGSTPMPAPDLVVGGKNKHFAIECKSVKASSKYFKEGEIEELILFANKFGAQPYVAIRFNNRGWFFVKPENLKKTNKTFCLSYELAKEKGISFEKLIE